MGRQNGNGSEGCEAGENHGIHRTSKENLPNILREKVGTGHADWDEFLQAVRDVDIDHICDSVDIWNKKQSEQKAIERRIQILETSIPGTIRC